MICSVFERVVISRAGTSLRVIIHSRKQLFQICFFATALSGWFFGFYVFLHNISKIAFSDIIVSFLVFAIGGAIGGYYFLWILMGSEMIFLSPVELSISKKIGRFGRKKKYIAHNICNLRMERAPAEFLEFVPINEWWQIRPGVIAFDYGSSTVRFGKSLSSEDATRIIEAINAFMAEQRDGQA